MALALGENLTMLRTLLSDNQVQNAAQYARVARKSIHHQLRRKHQQRPEWGIVLRFNELSLLPDELVSHSICLGVIGLYMHF